MARLPALSGKKTAKALVRAGYRVIRQRGSHVRLACLGKSSITVPNHAIIGRGLLRKILRDAELSPDEFLELL